MGLSAMSVDQLSAPSSSQPPRPEILHREVRFRCEDGFELGGTFVEGAGDGPSILISSATGVPKGLYLAFSIAAARAGSRGVLFYDYRGTGVSMPARSWKSPIPMRDWALKDLPAAVVALDALAPGKEMVGVGQSFGGQALGLSGVASRFSRYALVTSMSGYFGGLDDPKAKWLMRGFGVPVATIMRQTPKWLGVGEPVPGLVFREWAKWCGMKNYFFDDPTLPETSRFAEVTTPILSVRVTDDIWGTERAVEALLARYSATPIERLAVGPKDAGGQPIGHLGFFRSRFAETLWPPLIDWLLKAKSPAA